MSMYNCMKLLAPAVEKIGKIETVDVSEKSEYMGPRVIISGCLSRGGNFRVELTIEEDEKDDA